MSHDWFFRGKKVTQLGLGLLGRGIKDAAFMAQHGAKLTVTDKKTALELASSLEKLSNYPEIEFVLGEHRLEDFENCDFILKAAGIPLNSPYIAHARELNIPVYMDEALFLKLAPPILHIGVTGTRGKTTTTSLIHHCLQQSSLAKEHKIFLGGNIQDTATLPFLDEVQENDILVSELSSWQLQGYGDIRRSPNIAVFTNLLADHLPYYGGDMRLYFEDKAQIFRHMSTEDFLICTPQTESVLQSYAVQPPGQVIVVHPENYQAFIQASSLIGEHNQWNIACAVEACRKAGMIDEEILRGVQSFRGVAGRLELLQTSLPYKVYNDTTSTTPDALKAALEALGNVSPEKSLTLIMGGADKNLDFTEVYPSIQRFVKAVYLTPGAGSERIYPQLAEACRTSNVSLIKASSTAEAVTLAKQHLHPNEILLFSPGCSSFAEFKNEYDRGEQFIQMIRS